MVDAFVLGIAAGYGIAIPVGPVALLIVQTAVRRGFRAGAAAGAGTATVDLVFAFIALTAGGAALAFLRPAVLPARLFAAAVMTVLAAQALLRPSALASARERELPSSLARTYLGFVALTLLNPPTIAYFLTFAIGVPVIGADPAARLTFACGAALASLSWQWALALFGSLAHQRITPAVDLVTRLASAAILLAFAAKIAVDALAT